MLTTFFALLLINSLYCIGFYKACSVEFKVDDEPKHGVIEESKMILWKVKYYSALYLGKFWSKPICLCPPCMASIHSSYVYLPLALALLPIPTYAILLTYPIAIGVLCAMNWILINIIEAIESYIERN